jgi:hypothetical protein
MSTISSRPSPQPDESLDDRAAAAGDDFGSLSAFPFTRQELTLDGIPLLSAQLLASKFDQANPRIPSGTAHCGGGRCMMPKLAGEWSDKLEFLNKIPTNPLMNVRQMRKDRERFECGFGISFIL